MTKNSLPLSARFVAATSSRKNALAQKEEKRTTYVIQAAG
jgi:hypothetical protein